LPRGVDVIETVVGEDTDSYDTSFDGGVGS